MSQLFTPIRLRDLEIRNRVWVSPDVPVLRRGRRCRTTGTWCTSARSPAAAPAW